MTVQDAPAAREAGKLVGQVPPVRVKAEDDEEIVIEEILTPLVPRLLTVASIVDTEVTPRLPNSIGLGVTSRACAKAPWLVAVTPKSDAHIAMRAKTLR
jgi:hypothetical protein